MDIKSFNPGNDVQHFITNLNQADIINVKPGLTKYPEMEDEFMKIAKRLLDWGIFQKMVDSQQEISNFDTSSYIVNMAKKSVTSLEL